MSYGSNYLEKFNDLGEKIEKSLNFKIDFSPATINALLFISVAIYIPVAYTFKPRANLRAENNWIRFHSACVTLASFFFGIALTLWCLKNFDKGSLSASWAAVFIGSSLLIVSALTNELKQTPLDGAVQRIAYATSNLNIALVGLTLAGLTNLYKLNQ